MRSRSKEQPKTLRVPLGSGTVGLWWYARVAYSRRLVVSEARLALDVAESSTADDALAASDMRGLPHGGLALERT